MTHPIRVAMIIQGYLPRLGGAERQLAALAPMLQSQGVEVHVLTRRYAGLKSFEIIGGVPVHRLPIPGPRALASAMFTLSALPLLRGLRPHLIHAHELLSPTTTAVMAKRLMGAPVVAKVLRGGALGDIAKLKRNAVSARRLSTVLHQVDAFIAISQEIDRELSEINVPAERRVFIPNGVDTQVFAPPSPEGKRARRARLGWPLTAPTVLYNGRLVPEKRVDQLIALWPAVRQVNPEAQLIIVGSGEAEAALKQAAGAGVRFAGYQDDVASYLQAADVFVLPSATEGLSNALLEALATGLPVVATSVGGAPDVIEHQVNGCLTPPDRPPALQEAILELLGDAEARARLGERARERVVYDYALPVIAGRLRELYDHLLQAHSSRRMPVLTAAGSGST